jgi:hypothetical protein
VYLVIKQRSHMAVDQCPPWKGMTPTTTACSTIVDILRRTCYQLWKQKQIITVVLQLYCNITCQCASCLLYGGTCSTTSLATAVSCRSSRNRHAGDTGVFCSLVIYVRVSPCNGEKDLSPGRHSLFLLLVPDSNACCMCLKRELCYTYIM